MCMTNVSCRWVFSSELPSAESSGHSIYNPSQSSTAQELNGYTWQITYADGSSAQGNVYQDTVKIGSAAVLGQAVEAAQEVSSGFAQDTNNDGLLGLGFSSINTGKALPVLFYTTLTLFSSQAPTPTHISRQCIQSRYPPK